MCGFVGVIAKGDKPFPEETLTRMTRTIVHRGPDDEGYFHHRDWLAMGFRRLSILDLSANGHQPMLSADGRYALVLNGEIYNYRELREELRYPFKSATDTEVVLAAFIQWGPDCVRRFVGMFAFMIANLETREVYVFRDPLGVKPLYLYEDRDFYVFCSEVKALLPYVDLAPNEEAFKEYLVFRSVLNRETLFKNVMALPPGHRWRRDGDGKVSETAYFNLVDILRPNASMTFEDACDETEKRLIESVETHLRSDVELGCLLSGGVDSSLLTAIATQRSGKTFHTFSVSFAGEGEDCDESRYQQWVSRTYDTEHHDFPMDGDTFAQLLPETLWAYEQPLNDPNAVCTRHLMKAVKPYVTVLLAGEGADESFLGYARFLPEHLKVLRRRNFLYRHPKTRRALAKAWPLDKGKALFQITRYNPAMYVLCYSDLSSVDLLLDGDDRSMRFRKTMVAAAGGDVLNEAILQDQACDLPQWFRRADGIGMASSLELRVPFCTVPMFEMANSIPYDLRVYRGERKAVLKKIGEKYLDRDLLYRKKIGFHTPLSSWESADAAWGRTLRETLGSESFRSRPFVDRRHFDSFYRPFLEGRYRESRCGWLWTYANLELWYRLFFEGGWRALASGE